MKVIDFLGHIPNDEITKRLRLIDQSLMELHQHKPHGYYVVCNVNDIDIINDEITLASFKNKLDYLDSGYNPNGDEKDILELCTIGICAYNHFNYNDSYIDRVFMKNLVDNLDVYINNGKVPRVMREYYIDVFERGNIDYLNNFLDKMDYGNDNERGLSKTKSTAVGRALSDNKEAAYARILIIPSILVLVYLVALVCYFIFFR